MSSSLPRYDIRRDYAWNYAHAPEPVEMSVPAFPGEWTFLGYPVDSPLGIPAGPLLFQVQRCDGNGPSFRIAMVGRNAGSVFDR